ncbi:stage III sporulation protein AF [Alkalibacillus flavidus]|uniref:Stage III sporulation protein AF n=1 Tax=Alkalibacillus flavidus TaxID=546021 RepID=A0ABV2KXI8_9BACI
MDYVTGWITQLIIFIFLATLLTLLIPKTSHESVIRVVFGMIILLLFLNPITTLLRINPEDLTDDIDLSLSLVDREAIENEIESKKREIQASSDAYILEQLTQELKMSVEEELVKQYDVEIQDVNVSWQNLSQADHVSDMVEHATFVLSQNEPDHHQVEKVDIMAEESNDEPDDDAIKTTIASFLSIPLDNITLEWEGERSM